MARPQIKANGGTPGVKAAVAAASTVTLTLDSLVGVRSVAWSVENTDETSNTTDYTLTITGSRGEIASFTALGEGTAAIFRVTINNGLVQGLPVPAETTNTIKVYVETSDGLEVGATGETFESDAVHGTTGILNAPIRILNTLSLLVAGSPVKFALYTESTSNITLSGAQTVDGNLTTNNERVLLQNQTAPAENGIWLTSSTGAWTRPTDHDSQDEIRGSIVVTLLGASNAGTIWKNTNTAAITVGVTAIVFRQLTNTADKIKLDAATSTPTLNTIAMWDAAAAMNATSFKGAGLLPTLGVLRAPNGASMVACRDGSGNDLVALSSVAATDNIQLGDTATQVVQQVVKTGGSFVSYDASDSITTTSLSAGFVFGRTATLTIKQTAPSGSSAGANALVEAQSATTAGTGGNLTLKSGAGAGGNDPGSVVLDGRTYGIAVEPTGVSLGSTAGQYGSGDGVVYIIEAAVQPTTNPTAGFIIYVDPGTGSLMARGSAGTVTPLAVA